MKSDISVVIENENVELKVNAEDQLGDLEIDEFKHTNKIQNEIVITEEIKTVDPDDFIDPYLRKNNMLGKIILLPRKIIHNILVKPKTKLATYILLVIIFIGYFIASMILKNPFNIPKNIDEYTVLTKYIFANNTTLALFTLTIIVLLLLAWDNYIIKFVDIYQKRIASRKTSKLYTRFRAYFAWIVTIAVFIACIVYVIVDMEDYGNLRSLLGIAFFNLFCISMSFYPSDINWRCLLVGIEIQIILGAICLKSRFGYELFKFLGDQIVTFLNYTNYGTTLVFGEKAYEHYIAFKGLPIALFFGGVVNVLYYFGAIQYMILKVAWLMNKILDTSPTESMIAVASIFLGQAEAPLLVKPFLNDMTVSELFASMLAGFSTVAGSALGAYVGFGVRPNHLLTASIMSAPASLALSKVIYPEIQVTKADWDMVKNLPTGQERNVVQAFSNGVTNMIGPVSSIIANLIAFRSLLQFFDSLVAWIFSNLNITGFGLVGLLQYPFSIIAYMMGVDNDDLLVVGRLLAKKVFVSELISYQELGVAINFRDAIIKNGTYELYKNGTISVPSQVTAIWNEKSTVICTYALCGFASFASIGICIGSLSALAPKRAKVFARLAVYGMIFGNVTCFCCSCYAGLLYSNRT